MVLVVYYTKNFKGNLKADGVETLECRFFNLKDIPDCLLKRHRCVLNRYLEMV